MSSAVDTLTQPEQAIHYPESDGQPMADNTRQFRWIVIIKENLETLFRDRADVFVAGDLLWYPVEGRPRICRAPDALVVFGRPKGDRGSYRQWEEAGIGPQVVFEIYSPANTFKEMGDKLLFYERYGVEEYYTYDPEPEKNELTGFLREAEGLRAIDEMNGWVSPRLGIRFDTSGDELRIFGPDGTPFRSHQELVQEREAERLARQQAEQEREAERLSRQQAEQEREAERLARQQAEQQAAALAARLRELGIDPEALREGE
jgi:Uma2 family endonuclease